MLVLSNEIMICPTLLTVLPFSDVCTSEYDDNRRCMEYDQSAQRTTSIQATHNMAEPASSNGLFVNTSPPFRRCTTAMIDNAMILDFQDNVKLSVVTRIHSASPNCKPKLLRDSHSKYCLHAHASCGRYSRNCQKQRGQANAVETHGCFSRLALMQANAASGYSEDTEYLDVQPAKKPCFSCFHRQYNAGWSSTK